MSHQDLPLLSNVKDIRARHYLLYLEPNFHNKVIRGKVIIFFEPTTECEKKGNYCTRKCFCTQRENNKCSDDGIPSHNKRHKGEEDKDKEQDSDVNHEYSSSEEGEQKGEGKDFEVVLDCCDIKIRSVMEVCCEGQDVNQYLDPHNGRVCRLAFNVWAARPQQHLQFVVSPWCIKIWKKGVKSVASFPQVLCIEYETTPQGKSLLWRNDLDGNQCVFTPGAPTNNRSLLPCQDPPAAMATWQAWVTVGQDYYVSMTGENRPVRFAGSVVDYADDDCLPEHLKADCCPLDQASGEMYCSEDISETPSSCTTTFYYHTTMVLPMATVALAIGRWETTVLDPVASEKPAETTKEDACNHYEYPCYLQPQQWAYKTALSVVYPISLTSGVKPLSTFLPYALRAAIKLLGPYPCRRLELVILPACFGSLGLASPNLIFLSPTVVIDDPSAFIRLSHEISHAWFGIVIGAQDWTEEWLSEGFATYMEDSIYSSAVLDYEAVKNPCPPPQEKKEASTSQEKLPEKDEDQDMKPEKEDIKGEDDNEEGKTVNNGSKSDNGEVEVESDSGGMASTTKDNSTSPSTDAACDSAMNDVTLEELSELRANIRYRTLMSEVEQSDEDLQTLRPMQGESLVDSAGVAYVKNGLNSDKTFLQVHYLKGYFLLKYLSRLVGREEFDAMLNKFVSLYHGQLILSCHVLDYFFTTFPQVIKEGITKKHIYNTWLHQPGVNEDIEEMYGDVSNDLILEVRHHLQFWEHFDKSKKRSGQTIKRAKVQLEPFTFPDQLVLLLEYLLELPKVYKRTLRQINEYYDLSNQCGDVRHRWCELAIKNEYEDLSQVERFLLQDQSMGVYLYGELIVSHNIKHRRLAEQVFSKIQNDMDENARMSVFSMLYGE